MMNDDDDEWWAPLRSAHTKTTKHASEDGGYWKWAKCAHRLGIASFVAYRGVNGGFWKGDEGALHTVASVSVSRRFLAGTKEENATKSMRF